MEQDIKAQLQDFLHRLNQEPTIEELDKTPDKKAWTLPISFVEMTLDELYLGQWSTQNFVWSAIGNEVQGSLELIVVHPITGQEIRRVGAASIVITVDSLSDEEKERMTKQERNLHALNPENKKPNALDLGFPKLKAECLKNAAQSLGKVLGRDLNRKKADQFRPAYRTLSDEGFNTLLDRIKGGKLGDYSLAKANFVLTEVQINELDGLYRKMVETLSPEPIKQLVNGSV
jgi:hypothetical protein